MYHKGDKCTYSLTRFTGLASRSLETLRALGENNMAYFKPLFNSIVLHKSFLHKGLCVFFSHRLFVLTGAPAAPGGPLGPIRPWKQDRQS